ncbi:putative conserved protein YafD, endonuclease/exonuclease/phosphatase (EEP) superfamily [Streptoalloteichus tenebrarius]|uniref:Conserved protein YafD, endonuclease/exonuclease/phosphatase (EEP) superfamily n=1 Tax=Streptoalloteichus tenebrarius (strain ATCC 17920 / DSM 40477 / JCM 4838 / CBS 697.72 / NBRC 16177 / NCIMB 11028 / NRRL B-12390 / A12253. 1 / ISP 5477) TaxID=1933 RepID=A0ABT1I3H7_STRSD|nr:endonuclease/exonuclease/phosphatase family protein [Streptoalloteichus tenebrarius]MCP2262271.1 putative conserved protein YafD, endonuclease/exonuclease/phosphatase (EEP) superfamily [Streptoalloteichus tenebrarius]BFF01565.1 endonuclease/exonuclease/phosphatase family protein [Streptoalloteichus tenebrarius]
MIDGAGERDERRDESDVRPRRRPGGRVVGLVLAVVVAGFLVAAALRLLDLDVSGPAVAVIALTPYTLALGLLLVVVAALLRRWITAALVFAVSAALATGVIGRLLPDDRPFGRGQQLRVMSANTHVGKADAAALVDLVRRHRVDVLSLQELTPEMVADLDAAGLATELPHRRFVAAPGASGSGVASRHPVEERGDVGRTTFAEPRTLVDLPGAHDIEITAVHSVPPVGSMGTEGSDLWRRELASLPEPSSGGPLRVLAGDFNATLDHGPLRRLVNLGYRDAAEQVGRGLVPTWPSRETLAPPVTLDHVLVDRRCPVDDFLVLDLPGSDHRAVLAVFTLPE